MRNNTFVFICKCGCGAELPWRYKGRQRIFASTDCRKKWHESHPNETAKEPLRR